MAAADSDTALTTSTCAHCQREIPSSNIALHSVHCARNLQKCEHCSDMVPRKLMYEHYDENHAPVNCSLCKRTIERDLWDLHTGIQCPQRMLACQYCEFELPAVDLLEHQDVCGNRTEYCQTCKKYIRLREWIGHELQFHTNSNAAAELSSDQTMLRKERAPAAAEAAEPAVQQPVLEKEQCAPAAASEQPVRRPERPEVHGSQRKQLLLTIAITGIAVLIGSILYQKKGW